MTERFRLPIESSETPSPLQLAMLISNKGTGSTLRALSEAIELGELAAHIGLVVSDKSDAPGLHFAAEKSIPVHIAELKNRKSPEARDMYARELASLLNQQGSSIAVMAGFATILAPSFFETFQGTTINIHPGLIPDPGEDTWRFPDGTPAPWNRCLMTEKAVANFLPLSYAGSSIHIATAEADAGPVLARVIVPVQIDDTIQSLYERLKKAEHNGLIATLRSLATPTPSSQGVLL